MTDDRGTVDWDGDKDPPAVFLLNEQHTDKDEDGDINGDHGGDAPMAALMDTEEKAFDGSDKESNDHANSADESVGHDNNKDKDKDGDDESKGGRDNDKNNSTINNEESCFEPNSGSGSDNDSNSDGDGDSDGDSNNDDDSDDDSDDHGDDDDDDDDDDDSDSDSEGEKPKDGISDYERLRLERIKRNQERLASLGLHGGTLKPKPQKSHRRKSLEPRVSLEPTRQQRSRSSKKRIDYAELPKLHAVLVPKQKKSNDSSSPSFLSKPPPKELTPEEAKRREKRKKERRHNERIPRFIYDEFQRIRSKRKLGLKKARRHAVKAEREKNHWAKISRKLEIQEQRQVLIRKREAEKQQREQETRLKDEAEREEFDCKGMTKRELLREIELRTPELFGVLAGHDREQSEILRMHQQKIKEKEDLRKRQSLERKLTVIDALDRFPKAMNEALTKLNGLLYSRAPKDSQHMRRSVQRKHGVAFGPPGQSKTSVHGTPENGTGSTCPQPQTSSTAKANPPSTIQPKKALKAQKKKEQENTHQQTEPPRKKQKLIIRTGHATTAAISGDPAAASTTKKPAFTSKKKTTDHAISCKAKSKNQKEKAQQEAEPPNQELIGSTGHTTITASGGASTSASAKKKASRPSKKSATGRAIPDKAKSTATASAGFTATNTNTSSPITKKMKRRRPSMALPLHSHVGMTTKSPPAKNKNTTANTNTKTNASIRNTTTKNTKRGRSSMALPIHSNDGVLTKLAPPVAASAESLNRDHNITEGPPATSGSSNTAKRQRKKRDARFVGGWISPKFSKELDRTWLERTKPIDNRPTVIVPDDVAKLAGVSAKKTAVFDLGSYVPQVGDVILYYPSAHKDVLNTHPDTLGSRQRNLLRVPLWARANRERNRLSKEDEKGTIWWTDEWVESLMTTRKRSKKGKLAEFLATSKAVQGNLKIPEGVELLRVDNDGGASTFDSKNRKTSLGDYPIICRVEKTHAEFPQDPYAKEKPDNSNGKEENEGTDGKSSAMVAGNDSFTTVVATKTAGEKRLSLLAAAESKKKLAKNSPQVRLAVVLKPLSTVIAPSENSGLVGGSGLGLAPNFTVVTFPVEAPLEPFVIPFCWAYASFHTLIVSETIWIQRSSSFGKDGSRIKSDAGLCGKGKIVDFFAGAQTKESESNSMRGRRDVVAREGALPSTSSEPAEPGDITTSASNNLRNVNEDEDKGDQGHTLSTTPGAVGANDSVRLMGNLDELNILLASLTKDEIPLEQAVTAALVSEKECKGAIPIREANIIVGFLRRYLEHFKPKTISTATSLSSPLHQVSSTHVDTTTSAPSLVSLILKTLPLRRGVLVAYASNRRQLYRVSPWNLVTLQPTDLSRSLQNGFLGYLDNSLREKAILCMKDLIENNSQASLFVPNVTELIAPSYFSAVPVGMSLDRILARLKAYGNTGSCYYTSMESILMDLNLIVENCLLYNNPESELVTYCKGIIPKCQTLIKNIIQNRNTKGAQKIAGNDFGGKKQPLIIPSFLNTPFEGEIDWEWLQQITPSGPSVNREKVTRQTSSSTWIPQCGESIFYSMFNHSEFVRYYYNYLDDLHCYVPDFQRAACEGSHNEKIQEDEFLAITSSQWLEGTVMSIRSSFPRPARNRNEGPVVGVTPILIIELRLHYTQCEGNIFVCWRPTFEGGKCKGLGLAYDSFLKPTWMSSDGMQIFPSNLLQMNTFSTISEDMSISITRCLDFLKQQCIDGISPDAVNPNLSLENAEHGIMSSFDSQHLPSYSEFFSSAEMKYSTRGIKRAGYKTNLKILSEVGYMPLWSLETQQNRDNRSRPRHESWMSFPSLCLELIRLRISNGYYKNLYAAVNDISESYVCTILFLLSRPWTFNSDRVSIRKIAKHLMSSRGNGKMSRISVKKKSKKKTNDEAQTGKNQNTVVSKKKSKFSKESPFDKLSEEEEVLMHQIFQIRKYHAAAMVFVLEASHVEKIFCLVSTVISDHIPDKIPDIDASKTANFTPDQSDGAAKIRRLLYAIGRDELRNRFKFSYRDVYKVKIKCGEQLITENGQLETTSGESILFEPSAMAASLPDGSQIKLRVRCGNQDIFGDKKIVTDRPITGVQLSEKDPTGSLSQIADPKKFCHSSSIGRTFFRFNAAELEGNEELVRTLFGSPGRMYRCIRCQSFGGSLLSCRVRRQHSNLDYDLVKNFKGTSGVDSLLTPWKQANEEAAYDMATTESNEQNASGIATNSPHVGIDVEEDEKREDAAKKDADEKALVATLAKQAFKVRDNLEKADKAHKLAGYLHAQAILLSGLEVKLSEDFISTSFPFDPVDNHYVFCIHCGCAGDLLICDGCPNVSHPKCAGLKDVPEGDWFCHKCTAKKALASRESHRIVVSLNEDAKNIQEPLSQKDHQHIGDNSKRETNGHFENINNNTNQDDLYEQTVKAPESTKTENSASQSLNLPSEFNGTAAIIDSKTERPEGEAQGVIIDAESNAEIEDKPSGPFAKGTATENGSKAEGREGEAQVVTTEAEIKAEIEEKPTESEDKARLTVINYKTGAEIKDKPTIDAQTIDGIKEKPTGPEGKAKVAIIDVQTNAEIKDKPVESLITTEVKTIKNQEEPKQIIDPGISEEEFDEKESELEKLLTELMNKRIPPKAKPVERQEQEGDTLDALGNTYVREFLSFIKIESAKELLSTKSGLIAKDLELWRKEKGMKPLSDNGYNSAVSAWKHAVRKASSIGNDPSDHKDGIILNVDNEALSTNEANNNLEILPNQGRKFCSYLGISDAEVFLAIRTSELSRKFASWRKKQNMSKLAGDGTSSYITQWKSKLRKNIASFSIEPDDDRDVPKGFKIRKLFEDGNHYEGQVISGPSKAFDEVKGKMVLCWRVKYLDDDEEEFTIEELDLWGIDKTEQRKDEDLRVSSPIPSVGVVNVEQQKSEDTMSSPMVASKGNDLSSVASANIIPSEEISSSGNNFTANASTDNKSTNTSSKDIKSTDNTSTDNMSTDNTSTDNTSTNTTSKDIKSTCSDPTGDPSTGDPSTGNDLTGNTSLVMASIGIPWTGNKAIGKKVLDLQFAPTNSTVPEEESNLAKINLEGENPKVKIEQSVDNDWDSSPLTNRSRATSVSNDSKPQIPCLAFQDSPRMRRRQPRRLSVSAVAVGDKPIKKEGATKDERSSPKDAVSRGSPGMRRRQPRRLSTRVTAVDGKSIDNAVAITGESSSLEHTVARASRRSSRSRNETKL